MTLEWIHKYQLFLFDFDGVLVNTERLHYDAYQQMCAQRGFVLDWDLPTYLRAAMFSAEGLKEAIYARLPKLQQQEPIWDVLYREKKAAYQMLLEESEIELMPGVEKLLKALETSNITRCVVTNSVKSHVDFIRQKLPILDSIPNWYTRENYEFSKPHPDGYLTAIAQLAKEGDQVVGFEDSPKGLKALVQTPAKAVFISPFFKKSEIAEKIGKDFTAIEGFEDSLPA